jgi:hypothetical protein
MGAARLRAAVLDLELEQLQHLVAQDIALDMSDAVGFGLLRQLAALDQAWRHAAEPCG